MRKMAKKVSFCLAIAAFAIPPASGEWVWTPELKGFINPRKVVMETPELQLGYARQLSQDGSHDRSIQEYQRFLQGYHDSELCDRAQFGIAESFENMGKKTKASQEYFKVIANYPETSLFNDVMRKEYEIADEFYQMGMRGGSRWKIFGDNGYQSARQVYEQIVKNQPYSLRSSPYQAAEAEYRIALCHYELKEYLEAELQFQRVWEQYRDTQWGQEAFLGLADCFYRSASPSAYSQAHTQRAERAYQDFLAYFPTHERRNEAQERVAKLREQQARSEYEVGQFYGKRLQFQAAVLTYKNVIQKFPDTTWAVQAGERIRDLK